MKSLFFNLCTGIIVLLSAASAQAQSSTNAFQVSYGMSFLTFDRCGDTHTGELYRKAVMEKLDHCPFDDTTKKKFHQWADEISAHAMNEMNIYIKEHGKLPDKFDGMKMTCQEQRLTEPYKQQVAILEKYAQGEIGVDTVIPQSCDYGQTGAP